MKKIDLHIHTVATISDSAFEFSLEAFKRYVEDASLDAVAVTNHDVFDLAQYEEIRAALPIVVLPGIEINVEKGHLLLYADPSDVEDFAKKTALVTANIQRIGDQISVKQLKEIFGDLGRYLLIPHYEKSPSLSAQALKDLSSYTQAGEVDSAKKFVRCSKDDLKLTPVLFSDSRTRVAMENLPTRHTYVDCGDITIDSLKISFSDKTKVQLSEKDGNSLWQALGNGQQLSTGLNVLVGARSSGKTFTLDELNRINENVKYIRQFQLVQQDEIEYERKFKSNLERNKSVFADSYLLGLKRTVDDALTVDLAANNRAVQSYVDTLSKAADEVDRRDAFSNANLFTEVDFAIGNTKTLGELIQSVQQIIENAEYRLAIERHVDLATLRRLIVELIETLRKSNLENEKRKWVNSLVKEIKQGLKLHTSATQVEDVNFYDFFIDVRRVSRFREMVSALKKEKTVLLESVRGFQIEAKRKPFTNALDVKTLSGVKTSFVDAFKKYGDAFTYLQELAANENLPKADLYKFFVKIDYRILNKDGFEVSGGERSEFRLLQEIEDAKNYDVLLIDEPESSFDNVFLRTDVNQLLKLIAREMPVVVVTHNSTVGASISADYVLFTSKEKEGEEICYRVYAGHPADRIFFSIDGKSIPSYGVLMDSLEAGSAAYEGRRKAYEAIKGD